MTISEDPIITIAKANPKSAQARAGTETVKHRLKASEQHLLLIQESFQQTSQRTDDDETRIQKIQTELMKLGQTDLRLVRAQIDQHDNS